MMPVPFRRVYVFEGTEVLIVWFCLCLVCVGVFLAFFFFSDFSFSYSVVGAG